MLDTSKSLKILALNGTLVRTERAVKVSKYRKGQKKRQIYALSIFAFNSSYSRCCKYSFVGQ